MDTVWVPAIHFPNSDSPIPFVLSLSKRGYGKGFWRGL